MCLECVFSSFSTDSGCTVELVSTNSRTVQYRAVFNRSTGDTTAEGCIADVATGQYDIRAYGEGRTVPERFIRQARVSVPPLSHSTQPQPSPTVVPQSTSSTSSTAVGGIIVL